jgi:hypothetical protein
MPAQPMPLEASTVHQLRVSLRGIQPPIWRRLQVEGRTTLPRLHRILHVVMGS